MKKIITTILVATGITAAVALAPPANASELSFLQDLNNNGVTIYDADTAVGWGYTICDSLNRNNGEQVIEAFYQVTNYDIPNRYMAYIWVESAVENLCPWHDHRGYA